MRTLKEMEHLLSQHKKELLERFNAVEIGIFGSYAHSEQKEGSDIDILVEFSEPPDLLKFLEMERILEGILKCKVDLVRKPAIRPELKNIITREVILI